jgi:AraC-like DNA-binding protein
MQRSTNMAYNYKEIYSAVNKQLTKKPTLRLYQLARKLNCSHPTIERAVTQNSSLSFRDFQKSKMLEKAFSLMRQGHKPREIALLLGYRWPENFLRFIKKSTGSSLSVLRKTMAFSPILDQAEVTNEVSQPEGV